jgi:N-acetylmuramoyl-L-alanine amidase
MKKQGLKGVGLSLAKKAAESAIQRKAAEDILGRPLPDWILDLGADLDLSGRQIKMLLLNAHGGADPKTGKYVTEGKRSPKWDDGPAVHGKNIYYEGIGSRAFNKDILFYLTVLAIPTIIVNDTWEDTPISSKRYRALKIRRDEVGDLLALELHSNATKEMKGGATGFEFFTYPGRSKSDDFAEILGRKMDLVLPDWKHRRFKPKVEKEARFGILKTDPIYVEEEGNFPNFTKGIPIVLSESGFMDNKKDCFNLLMDPKGRELIVKFHILGIVEAFQKLF